MLLKLECTKKRRLRHAEILSIIESSYSDDADSFLVTDIKNRRTERGIEGPIDVPVRTLSPVSYNAMNALNTSSNSSHEYTPEKKSAQSTIRSVISEPNHLDSPDEARRTQHTASMPHSTKTLPALSTSHPPQTHQTRPNGLPVGNGLVRQISSEFGLTRTYTNSPHADDNNPSANTSSINDNALSPTAGTPQWSSAVGRASLGKSGKVIDRLMGENDMLKRDLNIERLRAEESRQAVKMAEESKQTLVSRYESELHEAAVNKTLLRRKERQLTDLKTQINGEKQRADSAVERERTWREAMEKTEAESKIAVERAHDHAAMMDGRVNTMVNHWKDQNAELQRTVGKMSKQINDLLELRLNDDRKIQTLREVCEQQREMLVDLESKKDAIGKAFVAYKQEQEDGLRDIKAKAAEQEARNEAAIEETLEVLGKLKWALNVEKNVNLDRKV